MIVGFGEHGLRQLEQTGAGSGGGTNGAGRDCADHVGSCGCELQGDWRNVTDADLVQIMAEHLPFYGNLFGSYSAAKDLSK